MVRGKFWGKTLKRTRKGILVTETEMFLTDAAYKRCQNDPYGKSVIKMVQING